jgi:glucosamine kinase
MSAGIVLGIDGGGSKTLVARADRSGNVLGIRRGPGINPLDNRNWRQALDAQIRPFAGTRGLAGVAAALPAYGEVDDISARQRDAIAAVFGACPQSVLNDVDAAHIGAFAGGAGILILSGTGSMAWARDAAGTSSRVGGWGDVIGDEGSSYWIGRRILGAVSQSIDGRTGHTALTGAVFDTLAIDPADPVNGLEGWVSHFTNPRAQIAALAPLATTAAEAGDATAIALIGAAADELVRHYTAIAPKAGPGAGWSYAGGAFRGRALRESLAARIGRAPAPPRLSPIGGALLAAAQLANWPINTDWIERLAASLQAALHEDHEPQPIN